VERIHLLLHVVTLILVATVTGSGGVNDSAAD